MKNPTSFSYNHSSFQDPAKDTPKTLPNCKTSTMKDFKSKWTCESGTLIVLWGWYTCEPGPSHHAAAMPMTSPLRELYFVPAEMNGKQSLLGCLHSPEQAGSCWFNSSASCGTQQPTALGLQKTHTNVNNPQTSGNKNKSENIRGKLSMPPSFPHHSLRETTATPIF